MGKRWLLEWCCLAIVVMVPGSWWIYRSLEPKPFALPKSAKNEPWAVQSGLKIAKLRDRVPTVDRVVLVPDEATFLFAIRQWSLQGRWPILIEDTQYTKLFLDRFQPQEVIRLPAVNTPLPTGLALRQGMQNAVADAWDAPNRFSLSSQWDNLGWEPPGAVVTSPTDPAWPAAVALASDRGQPLVFLEGDFGEANERLDLATWTGLKTQIETLVKGTGYAYDTLGDAIDTVTLVKELAVKYESPENTKVDLAVTDGLGRHETGDRWAAVGWIYGTPARAVYQAMSAIFIDAETALFYDSYPKEEPWIQYEMNQAAGLVSEIGLNVQIIQRPQATVQSWKNLVETDLNFDTIWVNSKGLSTVFAAGGGDASVEDIPQLKYPAIVHFIHSWSATTPGDRNTVAGRWLENGAYLYVGSVHEPFLTAFIPPTLLARRLKRTTPFLIAARQLDSPPWKITTIGDPLAIISKPRVRLNPTQLPLPTP